MSTSANELLQAIHALLSADTELTALIGTDGVRDRLVTGERLPCLIMADFTTNDYSTSTEPGEEHLLTLQAFSDARGQRQSQTIAGRVKALLQDAAPMLETATLVNLQHVSTRIRREPKTRLFGAEMRFRAVTE